MDGAGALTLTFSEVVNAGSVDVSQFGLQVMANSNAESHTFTSATVSSDNSTVVTALLQAEDTNVIKALRSLAIGNSSAFLTMTEDAVKDMAGRKIEAITTPAKQVKTYTADTTPPYLVSYDLDMTTETLYLTFSETVDASSVDVTKLVFQGAANDTGYFLTGGAKSTIDSTFVNVTLTHPDATAIKQIVDVATSTATTYLSFASSLVSDTAADANAVVVVRTDSAKQVRIFTRDSIEPEIAQFSLDLTSGLMLLSFTETVNASSVNVAKLTLHSSAALLPATSYPIVAGTVSSTDSDNITIALSVADQNEIKRLAGLCTGLSNCFLSATAATVNDMSANPLVAVPIATALLVKDFNEDAQHPTLSSFALNLNTGKVTLVFDETVLSSSLNVTKITLSDPTGSDALTIASNGNTTSPNGTNVTINLSDSDLDILKLKSNIWSSGNTTLTLGAGSIVDVSENANRGTVSFTSDITLDTTAPELQLFDLDMNTGILKLAFSEVMNITSLKRELFQLLGAAAENSASSALPPVDKLDLLPAP